MSARNPGKAMRCFGQCASPVIALLFAGCGSQTPNDSAVASNSIVPTLTTSAPPVTPTVPVTEGTQPATPPTAVVPPTTAVVPPTPPSTTGVDVPPTPPSTTGSNPPAPTSEPESSSGTTTDPSTTSETTAPHTGTHDHCVMGYEVDPSDDSMASGFAEYTENGQTDAVLQPEIIQWMEDHEWQEAHFQWHNVRRCGGGGFGTPGGGGDFNPCDYPELAPDANECESAQDGYEFLVMHRHMLESLRQLWPSHVDQFEGWDKWPAASDYPELLQPYFKNWSNDVLSEASIADNIEDNLDMFANEGEFGMWIQCGSLRGGVGANSLHGALHFNGYPQNNQSHSVANQRRNLDSFIFWKLHGYIDKIWERYRVAKGQAPDEPALRTEVKAQCLEMDALSHYIEAGGKPPEETELPDEYGFFHETVRPGLENFGCATCHGAGEDAGLRLGYQISSADIVERLVNVDSAYATGYKLVVPGDPDNSWLYLKAAGLSVDSGAQCQGVANCIQSMPPGGGDKLPATDLANLRKWIQDGALPPTNTP
jgi:hypothetical protein